MTFKRPYGAGLAALAVGLFAATAAYAEPTVNKGDNNKHSTGHSGKDKYMLSIGRMRRLQKM